MTYIQELRKARIYHGTLIFSILRIIPHSKKHGIIQHYQPKHAPHFEGLANEKKYWKRISLYGKQERTNAKLPPKITQQCQITTQNTIAYFKSGNCHNCRTCIFLLEGSTYELNSGQTFSIKYNFNSALKNLIYVLRCGGYGGDYIGQTNSTLRDIHMVYSNKSRIPPLEKYW